MQSKFGAAAVRALRDKGLALESEVHEEKRPRSALGRNASTVRLTPAQQAAADAVMSRPGAYLLHGVTGSGKTEVYLSVIARTLAAGRGAIMLVPEISLTPQMLGIFRARFGDEVAVLHSGLNAAERYDEWKRLREGRARIALGAAFRRVRAHKRARRHNHGRGARPKLQQRLQSPLQHPRGRPREE